jgi:hypothetical protein
MFATLILTLLIAKPNAAALSPEMSHQLAIASQNYGGPPIPVSQLSNATGMYMSPTDDIWIYANAQDPQKDEFLRAWGANGRAIPIPGDDPQASSWSIIKWDLSGFSNTKLLAAQLILSASPDSGYTAKDAADAPLEARPVKSNFSEGKWSYTDAEQFEPIGTEGDIFGETSPASVNAAGFKIVIDLLKGPSDFRDYFMKAMKKDKTIAIAISSRIDPSKLGREGIYKVYSKDAGDPMVRPALRLVFDESKKKK